MKFHITQEHTYIAKGSKARTWITITSLCCLASPIICMKKKKVLKFYVIQDHVYIFQGLKSQRKDRTMTEF